MQGCRGAAANSVSVTAAARCKMPCTAYEATTCGENAVVTCSLERVSVYQFYAGVASTNSTQG